MGFTAEIAEDAERDAEDAKDEEKIGGSRGMGYQFQGFFVATPDEAVAAAVLREAGIKWPRAVCRRIERPFDGIGVSWVSDMADKRKDAERLDEQVGPWTRAFHDLAFVRIKAECFGGVCEYGGTAWRNGQPLWHEALDQPGMAPLIGLLGYLGVASETGQFEPLTRGYFKP